MTYTLRPNWRDAFGPLDLKMPVDPSPTMTDFDQALATHQRAVHEDSEDVLNQDGTWGPPDPGVQGGSGIAFGYSSSDLSAVVVAEDATYRRPRRYDFAHWCRQTRYAIAAWEMTHSEKFARRIVYYDTLATGALTSDPETIHLDDPGWIPPTLAQYHAMAQANPGLGLPWQCRSIGHVAYGRAMRHKVDRRLTTAWADMLLETCALAARSGTGQQGNWQQGAFKFEESGIAYTFHEMILAHGVLALCHRLHRSVPYWIFDLMNAVESLPRVDYYGLPSPVSFWSTESGLACASTGWTPEPQHGDPAFAWWSTNCIALYKITGDIAWKNRAGLIGPTTNTDEQSRKFTMLMRGAI